jgi:hypothetical protein
VEVLNKVQVSFEVDGSSRHDAGAMERSHCAGFLFSQHGDIGVSDVGHNGNETGKALQLHNN